MKSAINATDNSKPRYTEKKNEINKKLRDIRNKQGIIDLFFLIFLK